MPDPRVENFAKLLAHYSIYAKKGETIGVEGPDTTAPLIAAVYEELLRAGAFPVIRMSPVGLTESFMKNGQDLHFDQLPKFELAYARAMDGTIRIMGSANTRALSAPIPPAWPASPGRASRCGKSCSRRNGRSPSSPPRPTRRTRR
jgi:aminopeptidase